MGVAAETWREPADTDNTIVYPLRTINVDPVRLQNDLRVMEERFWVLQTRYKSDIKNWDGLALYSVNGDTHDLRCADHLPVYRTPAGEKCSYISGELLPQFGAPWLRVVFYRLQAGAKIGRHRDLGENRLTNGIIRIHIPVVTNERVVMYLADKPYYFSPGSAWYFDATAFHSVENNGEQDRIHLVIDLKMTDELKKHLKPLTRSDRIRLSRIAVLNVLNMSKYFFSFVRTAEGRKRIITRARTVFGRSPSS